MPLVSPSEDFSFSSSVGYGFRTFHLLGCSWVAPVRLLIAGLKVSPRTYELDQIGWRDPDRKSDLPIGK
jgi:hypothetical protein